MSDRSHAGSPSGVLAANVALHSRLAASYNATEPHFRPENVAKVRRHLEALAPAGGGGALLDLGCGTGFIIRIAAPLFRTIHGVDATPAMLAQVDRGGPAQVTLHHSDVGTVDVPAGFFDVVTCYSFLHHLADIRPALNKAFDSLRPGGALYVDLEPNAAFLRALGELDPARQHDPLVTREIQQVQAKGREVDTELGLPEGTFDAAEHGKTVGGFSVEGLSTLLQDVGFTDARFHHQWFLGQAAVMHPGGNTGSGEGVAEAMERHLVRLLPLSAPLFKYLGFVARKPS